jgi:hypothetical protein
VQDREKFIPSFAQGQALLNLDKAMDLTRQNNQNILDADRATESWLSSLREIPKSTQEIEQSTVTLDERMKQIAESSRNYLLVAQAIVSTYQAFSDLAAVAVQNELARLDMVSQRERERWQERSDMLRAAGLETSALYRNELRQFQEAEKERKAKEIKLKSKSFEQEKTGHTISAIMATAQAIIQAFATPSLSFNMRIVMAALAAATGAAQVATIQAQQNPYHMREGGWVYGPPSDNNRIAATGGEFVSTRGDAARNREALLYMRAGGTLSPQGGDIHLHINGNVIQHAEWIETEVIPAIRKAQRRGYRI